MEIKKKLLEISPYFASILAGLLFLFIGLKLSADIKGLFISISAAFFCDTTHISMLSGGTQPFSEKAE